MGLLKSLLTFESKAAAGAATDQKIVDLQAKGIWLLFEALKKEGFTEDQAMQIVSRNE